jgi:hypothetical protein
MMNPMCKDIELNGKLMGDSQLIMEHLSQTWPNCKCTDEHLTTEEKAISLAFNRLVCEAIWIFLCVLSNFHFIELCSFNGIL